MALLDTKSSFDDLEGDFDNVQTSIEQPVEQETPIHLENCPKCRGTGVFTGYSSHGSRCFKCDGRGKLAFKTSPAKRAKGRAKAAEKKKNTKTSNIESFESKHPKIAAWWKGSDFPFAISLRMAVEKFGNLTPGQLAAAEKCIIKLEAAKAEAAARIENAPTVDVSVIEAAFATATANGLKKPKLRLAEFTFRPSPANGKNAGAIYVTEDGEYMGKIHGGKFIRSRDCSEEKAGTVVEVAANPSDAATAYGKLTGCCSVCGRELTKGDSVERGIGPICAEKFGW